jgi:tetratricopeptide (TPR) repeat protein
MKPSVIAGVVLLLLPRLFAGEDVRGAAAAFQQGDLASAERALQAILGRAPHDPDALGLLGVVLDAQKRYREADTAYRGALQLTPHSASLLNNFGNHQMSTGDAAGARATFLKVVAIRPDHPNANLQLAGIAADRKAGVEALGYLDRLNAEDQSSAPVMILRMRALYLCGRGAEGDEILGRMSGAAEHDPRLAFSIGLALSSVPKYESAERSFRRALESAPGDFDVLYNLGLAASHAGHHQPAKEALEAALTQRPNDVDTLYNLAAADINLNEREAAMALLAQCARLAPTRADVQLSLANTASALGYYNDAAPAYEKYLKLAPGDLQARREHAFMLAAGGRRDEGLPALQAYVRSHPGDATAHYEIAVIEELSDPADAATHLDKALSIAPDFVPARFARGVLRYLQAKPADALPDLEFAAARYPDNARVLDRLGEAYIALDRFADAAQALQRASIASPNDARVLMHLSRALSETGRKEDARVALERFRAIGPDHVNRVPAPGVVDLLGLPPEQLYARYRAEVQSRASKNPPDAGALVRYVKLLLDEGNKDEASAAGARLLALRPLALLAAEAARALLDAERYSEARSLLEYTMRSAPTPEVQLDMAIAMSHIDGPQAALAQLDRVPESRRSGDYYLARGVMLESAGRFEDALAALKPALGAAPTRALLYEQASAFLIRHNRPADAVGLLGVAARSLPDNPRILLLQAAMFAFAQRADEAERALRRIENRWPEWAPAYVTYGILLEGEKRSEEAKAQLESAVALGGSSPEAYFYLAKATFTVAPEHVEEAAQAIAKAIAMAPGDPWMLALAGRIDYAKHDYGAAVEHLREAIRLRPNLLQARFALAQTYTALGRKEDAAREAVAFQRLREANPNGDDESGGIGQFLFPPRAP